MLNCLLTVPGPMEGVKATIKFGSDMDVGVTLMFQVQFVVKSKNEFLSHRNLYIATGNLKCCIIGSDCGVNSVACIVVELHPNSLFYYMRLNCYLKSPLGVRSI